MTLVLPAGKNSDYKSFLEIQMCLIVTGNIPEPPRLITAAPERRIVLLTRPYLQKVSCEVALYA